MTKLKTGSERRQGVDILEKWEINVYAVFRSHNLRSKWEDNFQRQSHQDKVTGRNDVMVWEFEAKATEALR